MVAVFVAKSSSTVFSRAALLNLNQYANNPKSSLQVRHLSFAKNWTRSQKNILTAIGVITFGAAGGLVWALDSSVNASGLGLHPPEYPWYHKGYLNSYDHASLRRGYEVYKQVCSACHSIRYVAFRNLVDVTHTVQEAQQEAADFQIEDGPDENGDMFMRSGKLTDYFPSPYKNEAAARAANNGAAPPDLTYAILTKRTEEDYIFSILTGYHDPPAGVVIGEGQHYNPYFMGGAISMARALYDDVIEYSDGTPATTSQLAKDVVTFLTWCSQPELETRHRYMLKTLMLWPFLFAFVWYMKRSVWTTLKSRRVLFKPPNYKK